LGVTISDRETRFVPNRAARWALVETINFYKSRGFVYEDPLETAGGKPEAPGETRLRLRFAPGGGTGAGRA